MKKFSDDIAFKDFRKKYGGMSSIEMYHAFKFAAPCRFTCTEQDIYSYLYALHSMFHTVEFLYDGSIPDRQLHRFDRRLARAYRKIAGIAAKRFPDSDLLNYF